MADEYANVTIAHKMHSDRRFDLLAQLGGWTRNDACWRMTELYSRCTALQTDRPPAWVIRAHLGLQGEQLLVDSTLGERCPDGAIRVKGGGLSGGDTDRFGWYEPVREQQREAGAKRAKSAIRGPGGRFGRSPDGTSAGQAVTSGSPSAGPAEPADRQRSPAPVQPPDSGFRIRDQNSLSRAIPPAVPEPVSVPAVSPPAPAREDIAGTQPIGKYTRETSPESPAPDETCARSVGQATRNTPANMRAAAPAFDPNDPFARGRLAEATWRRISDARLAIAAELKLPAPIPFDEITPGSHPRGFVELSTRIREAGANAPAVCDRVVENLIKQARAKRSIDWLAERAFGDKAWPNARDGVDPSARSAPSQRAGPQPAPPRPRDRDPPPKVIPRDQLAGAAELAESWKALGIAGEPTTEIHKRVTSNDDDTPTDTKPRKARTA